MISRPEAFELLKSIVKDEEKLSHATRVAEMMENMARQFHLNPEKQYLTGLLQDIDIPLIDNDWSRHGIEAQKMLAGLLPYQALRAIMAHDRNAGIKSVSKFSKSLEFADVVDNLSRVIPIEELRGSMQSLNFADLKKKYPAKLLYLRVIADFVQRWPEIRV